MNLDIELKKFKFTDDKILFLKNRIKELEGLVLDLSKLLKKTANIIKEWDSEDCPETRLYGDVTALLARARKVLEK